MINRLILNRTATAAVLAGTAFALLATGCNKKKEAPAEAAAATATVAAKPAPPPKPKAPPPPPDVDLQAGDAIVGWLSIRSITTLFDAVETIGAKMELVPPGASLRQKAYGDLTGLLAMNGVTGHEWLDKAQPLHVIFQDDEPTKPETALALLLPVTSEKVALDAMKAAKTGAEAKGHKAMLTVNGKPTYFDFIAKYMVVTTADKRFAKVKGFATRLAATKPAALVYAGLSVTDAVKTRKNEIDALLAQLDAVQKNKMAMGGAGGDYYIKMMRQWLTELTRLEITIDADGERVSLGSRVHATKGSKLATQLEAGRGRNAVTLASHLPANAYLAAVASTDPKAGEARIGESMTMLKDVFKLDDKATAALEADVRSAIKFTDGTSALAIYPDGNAALGMVAFAGARDPDAVLKVTKRVLSAVLMHALEMEKAEKKKLNPKATDDPMLAIVEAAIKDMKVDPLIKSFGPQAAKMGVKITSNTSKDGGASCDVIDLSFDWKLLAKADAADAKRAEAVLGDRTALTLCMGKDRLSFGAGPSALEQGRRAAMAKPAGLADAPVFKAAAARSVKNPSWLLVINAGTFIAAYSKVLPMPPAGFPTDRAITMGCGNRARSFACQLDVPVQVIKAGGALTGSNP